MRCLLVDDEPGIREGLAALLRMRGHEVHTAADVAAASELARGHEFDLVLTDWRLPDGTALPLFDEGTAPIVVISGHPEEVVRCSRVLAVMPKPLMPDKLFELVGRCAKPIASASANDATTRDLPCDVRQAVEAALGVVSAGDCEVTDDGTFVTLRCQQATQQQRAQLQALGGDLRWSSSGPYHASCELRWLRDGRECANTIAVAADGAWPARGNFAVDFHDTELGIEAMTVCCERAASLREQGKDVQLLNVPEALRRHLTERGLSSLLPKRRPIGPRMSDEMSALWG